jgi:hypothetical protein
VGNTRHFQANNTYSGLVLRRWVDIGSRMLRKSSYIPEHHWTVFDKHRGRLRWVLVRLGFEFLNSFII